VEILSDIKVLIIEEVRTEGQTAQHLTAAVFIPAAPHEFAVSLSFISQVISLQPSSATKKCGSRHDTASSPAREHYRGPPEGTGNPPRWFVILPNFARRKQLLGSRCHAFQDSSCRFHHLCIAETDTSVTLNRNKYRNVCVCSSCGPR
jgi:hypothetical protein